MKDDEQTKKKIREGLERYLDKKPSLLDRLRKWWALRKIRKEGAAKFYYTFPLFYYTFPLSELELWETDEEPTFSFDLTITATGDDTPSRNNIDYVD